MSWVRGLGFLGLGVRVFGFGVQGFGFDVSGFWCLGSVANMNIYG